MQLSQHIAHLLHRENYVVVPGLGGFVASPQHARLDPGKGLISPPSKHVLFNHKMHNDNGQLVQFVADMEKCSLQQAALKVENTVSKWKSALSKGEEVLMQGLGKMQRSADGKLVFSTFTISNFLIPSYGLEIASAKQIRVLDTGSSIKKLPNTKTETIVIEKLPVNYKRFKMVSVALIAALSLSAAYLYLLSFQPKVVHKAGINFFNVPLDTFKAFPEINGAEDLRRIQSQLEQLKDQSQKIDEVESQQKISTRQQEKVEPTNSQSTGEVAEQKPLEEQNDTSTEKQESTIQKSAQDTHYHVIASSLNDMKKVEQALSLYKSKGFEPIVIPYKSGRYRISIGYFASRDSAETFRRNIKNDNNIDGWILPK